MDRRTFLHRSAITGLCLSASDAAGQASSAAPYGNGLRAANAAAAENAGTGTKTTSAARQLSIRFSGFLVFQKVVDGTNKRLKVRAVKTPGGKAHHPVFAADVSLVANLKELPPVRVILLPDGTQLGLWDFNGKFLIEGANPAGSVRFSEENDGVDNCPKNGDWTSLYWLAHLRTLTGGDTLKEGKFDATFELTEGEAECVKPLNTDGQLKKWPFKDGGTEVVKKALSDTVQYRLNLPNDTVDINLDGKKLELVDTKNKGINIAVSSFPVARDTKHLEHFHHYYDFVDRSTGAIKKPMPQDGVMCGQVVSGLQIEPIYCPPAMF